MKRFEGVYTALVTPFNKDSSIDEEALRKLVDFQIEEGITGILPMGTTGESPTVTHEENLEVIKIVIEQVKGRVPVIAGTGSNSTSEAKDMTKKAQELGADASLQVTPYYNKPNQEGLYRHFTEIADSIDIPLIIYNIPGRTGRNIELETMMKLAAHPNITAVKEASGDIQQIMETIDKKPEDFTVLSGDDNLAFPVTALGGSGVVSVASNIIPGRMVQMITDALRGNIAGARQEHYRHMSLFKALLKLDTNPIPIKYALAAKKMIQEYYRLPMCPLNKDKRKVFKKILSALDII
jgi:4-hydroxy-tetrahydrodipicolinate synthase